MRLRAASIALVVSSLALIARPTGSLAQDAAKPAAGAAESWEQIANDEGITVFRREVAGSPVESRIVRRVGPLEQIVYTHVTTPPIVMKDRDFVTQAKGEVDGAKKRFVIHIKSVSDAGAPPTSYVRGEILHSSFILTSIDNGKKTQVITEIHADPKGSVAKWVVNLFQKNWPFNTIKNLRKQVSRGDVKESAELRTLFTEQGF
ncbi:MAG: START domain-containing protein [Polyangiaceae bacterium]|nr:START domain-containing protein [Polyangiaceae bacterium]